MSVEGFEMDIERQVEIMEAQINSPEADFSLIEKMRYLTGYFDKDPEFSREARDIVRGNISKKLADGW